MFVAPQKSWPFYAKLALVLFSLIALCYAAVVLKEVLSPLLFSLLFSIVLLPVTGFFERKLKLPGGLAAGLSVTLLLAVLVLVFYILGSQMKELAKDWPLFEQQINASLTNFQQWVEKTLDVNIKEQRAYVDKATSEVISSSTSVIGATVVSVSSILLFVVFAMIYTFFLLLYRRLILKFLIAVFKEENSVTVYDVVEQVQYIVRKYILGLVFEMLIVAAAFCIVFLLLGIKYAILLGLIAGIFNLIPYIGIFTSMALSVFITFATGAEASTVLFVVITYIGIHLVDSNLLLPLIVGSKVRINALVTVLGVVLGEMIWGISGMFLSIPVIAISKIIFDRVDSLKPWGMLLGEESENKPKSKKKIIAEAEVKKPD
ncbi:MAG: AI-2E family transporter [Flavitalea sp.]